MLEKIVSSYGIDTTKEQNEKLFAFCELLKKWSKTHSLTSMKKDMDLYESVADSIYPLTFLENFKNTLDIGSGAGFPALPLAIIKNDAPFTLCEPLSKKYAFLQFSKIELDLSNITIQKKRVEEIESERFDLITSRAVADSNFLVKLSRHLIAEGGNWLFYKGEESASQIEGKNVQIYSKNKRHYVLIRNEEC
jgi:16S rRNA (guanine527-N7)-methyltransferase